MLAGAGDADAVVVGGDQRRDRFGGEEGGFVLRLLERGAEEGSGAGVLALRDFLGGAGGDDLSAVLAGFGADVDDVVGGFDNFHVVFDDDKGVSGFDEAVEDAEEARDVVEVESGGGLVEKQERRFGVGVGEVGGEFEALGFAAGEEAGGLSEPQVTEADVFERLQWRGDFVVLGEIFEESERLGDGHFEDVVDRVAVEEDAQDVGLEAFAAAGSADEGHVAEELHFDALVAEAGAAFAASGVRVEAEGGRSEAGAFGGGSLGEEVADVVPSAEVDNGRRAGGFAGRGLVDHDDFADVFDAGEFFDRAGVFLDGFAAFAEEIAVEEAVDEGGLAGTGDARHAGEDAEREVGVDFFDVVERGAAELEKFLRFAAFRWNGNRSAAKEVVGGEGIFFLRDLRGRAGEHELSAGFAAAGSDVGEPVGGADDGFFVFDDEEGVSVVAQAAHDAEELSEVARVESDARFVHDKERVDERGAEAGGEVDALDFAAGEGARRAVEGEVAEADFAEVGEAGGDLVEEELRGVVARGNGHAGEEVAQAVDRARGDFGEGEGFVVRAGHAVVEGFGLVASAVALRAFVVAAVAAEEHADVHFVGLRLEPVEVALHAIPTAVVPDFVQRFAGAAFALDDPVLVGLGEILERTMQIDVLAARVADEVGLAFLRHAALERTDDALGEGARAVRDDALPVEADDASETAALGAGTERVVEAEEAGRGRTDVEVAPGAVPSGGEGVAFVGVGVDEEDTAFAEAEGGLDGFGQAGFVGGGDAVLDDVDDGREFFRRGFVGAENFRVEPDAEVALLLEELEKLGGGALFDVTGADGEGDEEGASGEAGGGIADDAAGGFGLDRLMTLRARGGGEAGEQEFEVVVDLGDGADGRAGGFDVVRLLDGDGGRDAFDGVDARFVHAVEELPRVGREGLDVTALSFGIDGVEGEGGFAGAARAGDDVEESARKIEVDTAEVVLARAADAEGWRVGRGTLAVGHAGESPAG